MLKSGHRRTESKRWMCYLINILNCIETNSSVKSPVKENPLQKTWILKKNNKPRTKKLLSGREKEKGEGERVGGDFRIRMNGEPKYKRINEEKGDMEGTEVRGSNI